MRFFYSLAGIIFLAGILFGLFGPQGHSEPPPVFNIVTGPGEIVVDLKDGSTDADLARASSVIGADLHWYNEHTKDEALAIAYVPDRNKAIDALAVNPTVEAVEPTIPFHALGSKVPNDPLYPKQWHMGAMGAPVGWSETPQGKGVVVAVIDTGVSTKGEDRPLNILPGQSFVPGETTTEDLNGHGTHCAGTIAQNTDNGIGLTGVAPQAIILAVKVLGAMGSGSNVGVAAGIDYACDQDADILSMSLGGPFPSDVVRIAVEKCLARGAVIVAAAGNDGREGVGYPAAYPGVIGVSSVGPDGVLAPYSTWGDEIDIAAPGGNKKIPGGGVWQETITGYEEYQGTSMATPHVAGALAVLMSTGHTESSAVQALYASAAGTGASNKYGHGTLDLAAALAQNPRNPNWVLFGFGGLVGFLLALSGKNSDSFKAIASIAGAISAGGLVFLSLLPLPSNLLFNLLTHGVLDWAGIVAGSTVGTLMLFGWPAIMMAVVTVAPDNTTLRPYLVGLGAGMGAHFVYGAITGSLAIWGGWMALAALAMTSLVLTVAVIGLENLERK